MRDPYGTAAKMPSSSMISSSETFSGMAVSASITSCLSVIAKMLPTHPRENKDNKPRAVQQ